MLLSFDGGEGGADGQPWLNLANLEILATTRRWGSLGNWVSV